MSNTKGHLEARPFSAYLPIAATALIIALVPGALVTSCMSIFFPLMAHEYGVQVSSITIYMTIGGLIMALIGPVIGRLCQKTDLRIIGAGLVCVVGLCFLSLSMSHSLIQTVVTGSIMMPCAMIGIGLFNPTLINRWFKDRAGTLVGFAAAFTGIGGVIFLQVDQAIISASDYHTAFLANAILVFVIALPCVLFLIRNKPSDRGMLPYVKLKDTNESKDELDEKALDKAAAKNWSVDPKVALKSSAFWIFCIGVALANIVTNIAQFFPTYIESLRSIGTVTFLTGTGLATFTMAGQAVCKLVLGAGSDASPKKTVLAASGVGIIAILFIWLGVQTALLPIGGFIFGMFYASPIVLMPLVAGAIFGTGDNYSVIWGRTMLPSGLLQAPAGVLWPWIAENFSGYGSVFLCGAICMGIFVVLMFVAMKVGSKLPHAEGVIPAAEKLAAEEAGASGEK